MLVTALFHSDHMVLEGELISFKWSTSESTASTVAMVAELIPVGPVPGSQNILIGLIMSVNELTAVRLCQWEGLRLFKKKMCMAQVDGSSNVSPPRHSPRKMVTHIPIQGLNFIYHLWPLCHHPSQELTKCYLPP